MQGPQQVGGDAFHLPKAFGELRESLKQRRSGVALAAAATGLGLCGLWYYYHYHSNVAVPPRLFWDQNDTFQQEVLKRCPSLNLRYSPTFWAANQHISSLSGLLRSLPRLPFQREIVDLPDGGVLALDWLIVEDDIKSSTDNNKAPAQSPIPSNSNDATPTLIVFHGLNGGTDAAYVQHLIKTTRDKLALHQTKLRAVIMNNRGVCGSELKTPKSYCGAYTEDVRHVIKHVRQKIGPDAPFIGVGYSLGANILVKYLGEEKDNTPLTAAVSVCNPFDFLASSEILKKRWLYDRVLTAGCVATFKVQKKHFEPLKEVDPALVEQCKRLYNFDEQFTRRVFGYASVEDYYRDASSRNYIKDVKIPLFVIHAWDDPIVSPKAIPFDEIKANSNVILASFSRGGHVGFPMGAFPLGDATCWADIIISEYIDAILELKGGRGNNTCSNSSRLTNNPNHTTKAKL